MRTGEEKPCIDEFMQDSVAEEKKEKKSLMASFDQCGVSSCCPDRGAIGSTFVSASMTLRLDSELSLHQDLGHVRHVPDLQCTAFLLDVVPSTS